MRTAIPTGAVFARSPSFIIKEDDRVVETVSNPCTEATVAGPCIAEFLASKGVDRVVGSPGRIAERELKARGMKIGSGDPEGLKLPKGLEALLPAPPPYPPMPRFLLEALIEGRSPSGSPEFPEVLKVAPEFETAEDVLGSLFHVSRGLYSLVSLRRTLERIFLKPK